MRMEEQGKEERLCSAILEQLKANGHKIERFLKTMAKVKRVKRTVQVILIVWNHEFGEPPECLRFEVTGEKTLPLMTGTNGDLCFQYFGGLYALGNLGTRDPSAHPFATIVWPFLQRTVTESLGEADTEVWDTAEQEKFEKLLPLPVDWQVASDPKTAMPLVACDHSVVVWLKWGGL